MEITLKDAILHNLELLITHEQWFSIHDLTKMIRIDVNGGKYQFENSYKNVHHGSVKELFENILEEIVQLDNIKIERKFADDGYREFKINYIDMNGYAFVSVKREILDITKDLTNIFTNIKSNIYDEIKNRDTTTKDEEPRKGIFSRILK